LTCQTLGLIASPKPPCIAGSEDECRLLLSEPNLPSILKYQCCSRLTCSGKGKIIVYGVDGTPLDVWGFSGCNGCRAKLPLHVSGRYLGPLPLDLKHVRELSRWLCGDEFGEAIQVDSLIPSANLACKVKLGCGSVKSLSLFDKFSARQLYPRVIVARSYSTLRFRVKRDMVMEAPWLCVESGDQYLALLCLEEGKTCSYEITSRGDVRAVEGSSLYTLVPQCPSVQLAKAYMHGLLYNSTPQVRPCIWSRTGLLIVGWVGVKAENRLDLTLAVWNPYPTSRLHTLSFERHRILYAAIVGPDFGEETLAPSYNQLRIPLPAYGLRVLKLKLAKLPSLLLKRR
jgi:hypothetical protein